MRKVLASPSANIKTHYKNALVKTMDKRTCHPKYCMGRKGDGAGDFYIRTLMRSSVIRKDQ
jgi:hypothetical protein